MSNNGVIHTAPGDLLRYGENVDFLNDGSFNPALESIRTDVPLGALVKFQPKQTQMHRWNGSAWILVPQPPRYRLMLDEAGINTAAKAASAKVTRVRVIGGEAQVICSATLTPMERTTVAAAIQSVARVLALEAP